ncbi:hypothetical protein V2J09_019928 [Rumex salicifolius]
MSTFSWVIITKKQLHCFPLPLNSTFHPKKVKSDENFTQKKVKKMMAPRPKAPRGPKPRPTVLEKAPVGTGPPTGASTASVAAAGAAPLPSLPIELSSPPAFGSAAPTPCKAISNTSPNHATFLAIFFPSPAVLSCIDVFALR